MRASTHSGPDGRTGLSWEENVMGGVGPGREDATGECWNRTGVLNVLCTVFGFKLTILLFTLFSTQEYVEGTLSN